MSEAIDADHRESVLPWADHLAAIRHRGQQRPAALAERDAADLHGVASFGHGETARQVPVPMELPYSRRNTRVSPASDPGVEVKRQPLRRAIGPPLVGGELRGRVGTIATRHAKAQMRQICDGAFGERHAHRDRIVDAADAKRFADGNIRSVHRLRQRCAAESSPGDDGDQAARDVGHAFFFTGDGAPPPSRTDADASPRIRMSSARHGRRRSALAVGPHPQRELTLMPRLGFACPRLGMAAGALHWRWGPTPIAN